MRRPLLIALAVSLVAAVPSSAHVVALPSYLYSHRDMTATPAAFAPRAAASCPTKTDPATFESTQQLLADNQVMSDFGRRPTGSVAQLKFVSWLERKLGALRDMQLGAVPYTVDRWVERGASLRAGAAGAPLARIPISGAVPYAHVTPNRGAPGQLVYLPPGTAIAGQNVKGKIVVRDAVPGSVPFLDLRLVEWTEYDPDHSLLKDIGGTYERDFAGYNSRITDLEDAAQAGASGLIMVHGFPRAQVKGQYAPYEGVHWKVPALYVGADEGQQLKALAAKGGSASISIRARDVQSPTHTIVATLPGISPERMIVESHTDGMNAIWDNGPIAILALARHFASLPQQCRPRTLQFVFTTGHIYQRLLGGIDRGGSSEQVAKQADKAFDKGTLAMAFASEHLGAREYAAVPRTDGGPGRVLKQTGRSEINTFFSGESPVLVSAVDQQIVAHNVARSFLLRGSDTPASNGLLLPLQNSFGGEGTAYQQHLVPTVALVAGPWTLYNPAFGMEAIDGDSMRKQTLVFSDLIHQLASTPTALLGGGYLVERDLRSLICASALATLGFTRCAGDAYG